MTSDRTEQAKVKKTMEKLLKEPGNRMCAECNTKQPRWASANLGVFLCIRCSGIHRNLGVHISKVKSVNLDKWTMEQVEFMATRGNAKVNALYEHTLQTGRKPQETDSVYMVEGFIRDKYEKKLFLKKGKGKVKKAKEAKPKRKDQEDDEERDQEPDQEPEETEQPQEPEEEPEEEQVEKKRSKLKKKEKKKATEEKTLALPANPNPKNPNPSTTTVTVTTTVTAPNLLNPDSISFQTLSISSPSAPAPFQPNFSLFDSTPARGPNNEQINRFFAADSKTTNTSNDSLLNLSSLTTTTTTTTTVNNNNASSSSGIWQFDKEFPASSSSSSSSSAPSSSGVPLDLFSISNPPVMTNQALPQQQQQQQNLKPTKDQIMSLYNAKPATGSPFGYYPGYGPTQGYPAQYSQYGAPPYSAYGYPSYPSHAPPAGLPYGGYTPPFGRPASVPTSTAYPRAYPSLPSSLPSSLPPARSTTTTSQSNFLF